MSFIARLAHGFQTVLNILNERTVEIYFQRSPGVPHGQARGIDALQYRAYDASGNLIQQGTTADDGRINLRVRGGQSVLKLVRNGTEYATYEITISAALRGVAGREGQKERLRLLGYQLGHSGPDRDGVDNQNNAAFERAVLCFQADKAHLPNASVDATVRNGLTTDAGG